jgi:hypothetical protein
VVPSASAASSPAARPGSLRAPPSRRGRWPTRPRARAPTDPAAATAQARGQSSVSRCPRRARSGAPSPRRQRRARETAPVAQWGIDLHHGRWLLVDAGILPGGDWLTREGATVCRSFPHFLILPRTTLELPESREGC